MSTRHWLNSRNGWEREHTTLGTFWFPHGESGIWTVDFYEHIWGYGSSHAFSSCDLIRVIFVASSPRKSYLATLPICQDRMNAMQCHRVTFCTDLFSWWFFLFWVDLCFMFSTRRLFDLVMYTTASCLFPRCVRLLLLMQNWMLVSPYDTMSKMIPKSNLHNSISRMGTLTRLGGKFLRCILCSEQLLAVWILI